MVNSKVQLSDEDRATVNKFVETSKKVSDALYKSGNEDLSGNLMFGVGMLVGILAKYTTFAAPVELQKQVDDGFNGNGHK